MTINKLFLIVIISSLLLCSQCRDTRSLHLRAQILKAGDQGAQVFCTPSSHCSFDKAQVRRHGVHCKMPCVPPGEYDKCRRNGRADWRRGIEASDHSPPNKYPAWELCLETVTVLTHKSQKALTIIKQHFFLFFLFLWTVSSVLRCLSQ